MEAIEKINKKLIDIIELAKGAGLNIALPNGISTSSNQENEISSLNDIKGLDFIIVSDTSAHLGTIYAIEVCEDAMFSEILVGGSNVVTSKGLNGKTVTPQWGLLPFGKAAASSVTLTSGTVKLYLR